MKKFLLSTMLVASAVGGFPQAGWTQTLAGQGEWVVKKVAADTPYCTLGRTFEANALLTLAQNARGEGTIALDFQRNAFDVTRPYPVLIQIGNISRQYAVKPTVANAIILRVGSDTELFRAMRDNNVLNLTIDNEKFSLNLDGYDAASNELSQCLGLSSPQAIQNIAPASSGGISSQAAAEQNARLESLLAENKRLTQELLARDQQQQQMLQQSGADNSAEKEQLSQQLAQSEQKNTQLLAQIQQLESNLKASQQSINPDMSRVVEERNAQIAQLTQQNQTLKSSLDEATAQLESQTAAFTAERQEYQKQLAMASASDTQEMTDMRNRLVELQKSLEAANAEKQKYQTELQTSSSEDQVKALNAQLIAMEEQIAATVAERDQYQKQLQAKTKELADVSNREPEIVVKEVPSEKPDDALALRVAEAETAAESLRAERDEYQRLLQEERANAQNAAKPEDNKNLIGDIERLEAEKADLTRKLAFAESQIIETKAQDSAAEIVSLQTRLQNMEAQLLAMTTEKANLEDQLSASQTAPANDNQSGATPVVVMADAPIPAVAPIAAAVKPKPAPVAEAVVKKEAKQPAPIAGQALNGENIRKIIAESKIPLAGQVDKIDRVSGPDFAAFRWDTGVVYGSGEQSRMANVAAFENSVAKYIEKTESRCNGQFAQNLIDMSEGDNKMNVADISCVDANGKGTAASILFFTHEGMFYALAHEAGMKTFAVAKEMRDQLTKTVKDIF